MLSLEQIRHIAEQSGRRARKLGKTPLVFSGKEAIETEVRGIPNLGEYVPKGWEHLEGRDLFADKTGWGSESEPALTFRGLCEELGRRYEEDPAYGYGIVEEGEFQIYVGTFKRAPGADGKKKIVAGVPFVPDKPLRVKGGR